MTNHPGRKRDRGPMHTAANPGGVLHASAEVLADLQARAGLTDLQMAALVRSGPQTWRQWRMPEGSPHRRQMPLAAMELLCMALMVGTLDDGPFIPPGDWALPYIRREFALLLRRTERANFGIASLTH